MVEFGIFYKRVYFIGRSPRNPETRFLQDSRTENGTPQMNCEPRHLDQRIREVINQSLRRSRRSRSQVADEMSRLLDRAITRSMLDGWSAQTKQMARFPLAWLWAFCEAVGDDALQREVLSPALRRMLEFGEMQLEANRRRDDLLRDRVG